MVQREVLYLGEITDRQEAAWERAISVFDEDSGQSRQLALFPSDVVIDDARLDALPLVMSRLTLGRPRSYGDVWLGCVLWDELGLGEFWQQKLSRERGGVAWFRVLQVLDFGELGRAAVNRLCDPATEFAVHRKWFLNTAMDELLGVDFAVAAKDRLYRCLDRIVGHKDALCQFLVGRWKTLFDASFDVLLYDLTSTYFEGSCQDNPKAKHGYSRDGRPDCRQVVIALVVTTEGLPMAYEVLDGNRADKTTLAMFLQKIQSMYGTARRVWVMDRGIPTTRLSSPKSEATLAKMRDEGVGYLVGTPRSMLGKLESQLIELPWEQVHTGMKVRLLQQDGELFVQASSRQRQLKETAMRRGSAWLTGARKLKRLIHGLNRLKHKPPKRDTLLKKVAVLQKDAGRVKAFVTVIEPGPTEPVNRSTFVCTFDKAAWKASLEKDGTYILRANIPWDDFPKQMDQQAPVLWKWYMQLVRVEEAFKTLKSDLDLRPIHHQLEHRVEAHILVAFLGYCLSVTLRTKLKSSAPGLTTRAALDSLAQIQLIDVQIPTTDGRQLILPRHTEPQAQQQMILDALKLSLPKQPPPRLRSIPPAAQLAAISIAAD